jgi:hypothetical protein
MVAIILLLSPTSSTLRIPIFHILGMGAEK